MKRKVAYKGINQVMKAIREQIIYSYNYCANNLPSFNTPEQLYNNMLPYLTYKNDPPGVELLQSVPTLFENNYWGKSGCGDCDCFVILICSMCQVNRIGKQRIVLAGRTKDAPVHIWSEIYYNGQWCAMDMTQKLYNSTRPYKYIQYLYI